MNEKLAYQIEQAKGSKHSAVDMMEKLVGENWPHAEIIAHEKSTDKDGAEIFKMTLKIPSETERNRAAAAAQAGAAAVPVPGAQAPAPVQPALQPAGAEKTQSFKPVQVKVAMGKNDGIKDQYKDQYPKAFLDAMGL
jgi:hypothetical protein